MKAFLSTRYGFSKVALSWLILVMLTALLADWLPLSYSPDTLDQQSISLAPSTHTPPGATAPHWLGTDFMGRDVLALLVYGTRTALLVSVPAAVLSTLLGAALGSMAGFWGNRGLRLPATYWFATGAFLVEALVLLSIAPEIAYYYKFLIISVLCLFIYFLLDRIPIFKKTWSVPIDSLVRVAIALIASIPLLVLVLALAAVQQPSLISLLVVLVGTYWTGAARLARAEVLRIRSLPFIDAAYAAGLPARRVLWRHALPNAWHPVLVSFPMGVASLIGLETTLSFLGIGLPPEVPSWGHILAAARSDTGAWWLVVFPGLALVFTTLSLRQIAGRSLINHKKLK